MSNFIYDLLRGDAAEEGEVWREVCFFEDN